MCFAAATFQADAHDERSIDRVGSGFREVSSPARQPGRRRGGCSFRRGIALAGPTGQRHASQMPESFSERNWCAAPARQLSHRLLLVAADRVSGVVQDAQHGSASHSPQPFFFYYYTLFIAIVIGAGSGGELERKKEREGNESKPALAASVSVPPCKACSRTDRQHAGH